MANPPAESNPFPEQPIPPVNFNSPLVAVGQGPRRVTFDGGDDANLHEDTFAVDGLKTALRDEGTRLSEAELRKTASAPHSMHKLGDAVSGKCKGRSGGPMRRVATSIGPLALRRNNSFMWTMEVHRDFETAVQALMSRVRGVRSRPPAGLCSWLCVHASCRDATRRRWPRTRCCPSWSTPGPRASPRRAWSAIFR